MENASTVSVMDAVSPSRISSPPRLPSNETLACSDLVSFSINSDLGPLGEDECLLATPTDLVIAIAPAGEIDWGTITDLRDLPLKVRIKYRVQLASIEKIRALSGTGCGQLQVKQGGIWRTLVTYSNALADRFHHATRGLELLREGESNSLPPELFETTKRCGKCQLRLENHLESCPRCLHRSKIAGRIWELVRPQVSGTILLCALTIAGVVAELVPPKLQQYLVDHILADHAQSADKTKFLTALLVVVLALAGSRVVLSLVGWYKGRLATAIGSSLTYRLRARMVERLQQLAIAYYDRHQAGSLMSRVAYDSEVLQGLLHQLTGGFLLQILQLVGVGAMLIWLNAKLAMYTLIPVPLVVLGTMYFWRYVYPRYYRLWDSSSKQIAALSGMLAGIRVVKAFAQEQREANRFDRASTYLRDSRLWVDHATSAYSATMQVVFSLGGLIVWYVGGRDVIGQDMTLGELIAFLAYLAMFYAPLATLSNFTTWLTSFLTGSKRVLELLDTPIAVSESANARPANDLQGAIEFDKVTFGYDRHQPIIHNVSFRVAPGEMVGIVGRSGSGKTTMINLLGRFYDVQEGRILVDDVDIRDYSMESLRANLGIVFQDSFMFRGTIWDNLVYGRCDATPEEALRAAKAAGAHDFICRNALAYESPLGESGSGLSGGEKQRLSIARTLLYDPKILVLDEATSNIDAEAEKSIQQALEVLIKGRTTIAIAHRLSTLRNADRILVFDRGKLIEQGTHAELLECDGTYARLVRLQTQISKDPSVDKLVGLENDPIVQAPVATNSAAANQIRQPMTPSTTRKSDAMGAQAVTTEPAVDRNAPNQFIRWLTTGDGEFWMDEFDNLGFRERNLIESADPKVYSNVFAVACFPATRPNAYLSIRTWTDQDEEIELGVIESLAAWPPDQQRLIMESLSMRYLLPQIQSIRSIDCNGGYLDFACSTDRGPKRFTIRWSQSQAIDFGDSGKLLIDTEDNRFVVPCVERLPKTDQERFRQFIYW